MRTNRGFTLIELLISIILMIILLSAVTLIFMKTTDTVAIAQARITVYTNARHALDIMENDLLGTISFNGGQRFAMENGKVTTPGGNPQYNVVGFHYSQAADKIVFRATTTIGNTVQTGEITYELIPANMALGASGVVAPGDGTRDKTLKTARPLYILVRRTRVANPTNPTVYDQFPLDSFGNPVNDTELAYYVTSFNLEYFANNMTFSQLEPSYFTTAAAGGGAYDPLGNGLGQNDGIGGTAIRVPYVRATIIIVDDIGERQERAVSKAMWIPMG